MRSQEILWQLFQRTWQDVMDWWEHQAEESWKQWLLRMPDIEFLRTFHTVTSKILQQVRSLSIWQAVRNLTGGHVSRLQRLFTDALDSKKLVSEGGSGNAGLIPAGGRSVAASARVQVNPSFRMYVHKRHALTLMFHRERLCRLKIGRFFALLMTAEAAANTFLAPWQAKNVLTAISLILRTLCSTVSLIVKIAISCLEILSSCSWNVWLLNACILNLQNLSFDKL